MVKGNDGRRLRHGARLLIACMLAAALALVAGCGGSEESPPPRKVVKIDRVARDRWTYARARFNEMCAGCHGLADAGARGRRFILDRAGGIDEARARYAIAEGEPGMPAWRDVLSKREFEELVAYVSTVERNERGEDGWLWQIRLRSEGDTWPPRDASR